MENENGIRVSISVSLKCNLGNYESADAFVSLSNVPVGASESDIEAALSTGKLAWGMIADSVKEKALLLKAGERGAA